MLFVIYLYVASCTIWMPSGLNKGYLSLKGMQRYNYLIFAKCFISVNACYKTQSW